MKKVSWVIVILLFAQACRSGFSDRIEQIPVSSEDTIFTTKTLEATEAKERYSELFYFKQKLELEQEEAKKLISNLQENASSRHAEYVASLAVEQNKAKILDSIVLEKDRDLFIINNLLKKEKSRSDELASQIGSFQENKRENIFNIIDKALDELPFGNAVFTAKNHMLVGETQVAKLVLSVSEPLEKLREILGQRKDSERVFLEKSQIQVAPFMKATLIPSPGLLLRTIQENDGERVIDTKGIHEWSWELTAIKPGEQNVTIHVFVILNFDGKEKKYIVKTFDSTISIRITTFRRFYAFMSSNWQWAWGSWVVPIIVIIRNRWKERRKRK